MAICLQSFAVTKLQSFFDSFDREKGYMLVRIIRRVEPTREEFTEPTGRILMSLKIAFTFIAFWLSSSVAFAQGKWLIEDDSAWKMNSNVLVGTGKPGIDQRIFFDGPSHADVLMSTLVKFEKESARHNFGFVFRANEYERLVLRYYDKIESLELLSFHGDTWKLIARCNEQIKVQPGAWYHLQLIAVGSNVSARMWPKDTEVPHWQLISTMDLVRDGRVGVAVHDAGIVSFKNFSCDSEHELIGQFRDKIDKEQKARFEELKSKLKLAVAPESFPIPGTNRRRIEIAPFADNDRINLEGTLKYSIDGREISKMVTREDYLGKRLFVEIPKPIESKTIDFKFLVDDQLCLEKQVEIAPAIMRSPRYYVTQCIDTILQHGRDQYGEQRTPLIIAVLDTSTLRSPSQPESLDAMVRLEGRLHRRGERGSNLWYDQSLIKAMRRLSELEKDDRYARAAQQYTKYFLEHCKKRNDDEHHYHTGLPAWGSHVYWNCYTEQPDGDLNGSGPHEILVFIPDWTYMYSIAPQQVEQIAAGIWEHHIVDKRTGKHNRHDDGKPGCDFAFSGSSFIQLFASLYKLTGKRHYLDKAKTVTRWHWENRNQATGLVADCPGLQSRYDGQHCFTTVPGPHAMTLLESYRITGDEFFKQVAITYIKSFDKYAWDKNAQTYYAMLKLDGTPLGDQAKGDGYDAYAPYGHVNVWRTTFFSYEFTLAAAQASITAYELSGDDSKTRDPQLLTIAKRWAKVIEKDLPAKTGRRWKSELENQMPLAKTTGGAYAEDYGRAILFFTQFYHATGDQHFNSIANELANDAIRKLYHNGLFKGHPAKPYYETTNGVGILLLALLQLDEQ